MAESAEVLQDRFGISPATVSWELLSQSPEGSVLSLGIPDEFDVDDFEDSLDVARATTRPGRGHRRLGRRRRARRPRSRQGGSISPQFSHWAVDRDRHLVLASDDEAYLGRP